MNNLTTFYSDSNQYTNKNVCEWYPVDLTDKTYQTNHQPQTMEQLEYNNSPGVIDLSCSSQPYCGLILDQNLFYHCPQPAWDSEPEFAFSEFLTGSNLEFNDFLGSLPVSCEEFSVQCAEMTESGQPPPLDLRLGHTSAFNLDD